MSDTYRALLLSTGIFFIGGLLSLLIARLAKQILGRFTASTKSETDDFILEIFVRTIKPLGWITSASIAWTILPINEELNNAVLGVFKLLFLLIVVRFINKLSLKLIQRWAIRIDDPAVSTMLRSLSPMIRATIWCIGFVFYLQNMGVQMAAIWALLSAGGIGAGLALKEPVQEFFEYITILLDKPFQNGQFIHIDDVWATVERVGVRSTRLRSINGEIIVMSNSALTNGIISNYTEMEYRRITHKIGVVYHTPRHILEKIPGIVNSIIELTDDAIFDRCHFVSFEESNLCFEIVYFVPTNDYVRAMIAQQNINLGIIKSFEEEKIEFAFPTQTVNIVSS